jgi:hypothetical protein
MTDRGIGVDSSRSICRLSRNDQTNLFEFDQLIFDRRISICKEFIEKQAAVVRARVVDLGIDGKASAIVASLELNALIGDFFGLASLLFAYEAANSSLRVLRLLT